ncbi:MAG: right-handed parallel beta-helix repeat-containing protein, partial [Planctomycetes bacterium]|nr:right-handed parallel beta-helix repeat-containing protein [Planctomycetota bacterium]
PGADYIEIYFNSSHNLVEDCEFGAIQHIGVSLSPFQGLDHPQRNIVRHCVFRSPRWKSLGVGGSEYTLVENNLFTGTGANFVQLEASKNIFRRNVFAGYRLSPEAKVNNKNINGVFVMASKIDYRKCEFFCRDNHIFNNLFYDNEQVMSVYSWKEPFTGNLFKNNIFSRNGSTVYLAAPNPGDQNANYFVANMFFIAPGAEKLVNLENQAMTLAEAVAKFPELYKGNREGDPLLTDPAAGDYALRKGSPCIDAAQGLTTAIGAGEGTELHVADALYFCDGNGLIEPDVIRIGDTAAVAIAAVDYEAKVITLAQRRSWKDGAAVNLDYAGAAPDVGPCESGAAAVVFGPRANK